MNRKEFFETLLIFVILVAAVLGLFFAISPSKGSDVESVVLGTRTGRLSTDYYVVVDAGNFGVVPVRIDADSYFNNKYSAGDKVNVHCYTEVRGGPNVCEIK